MSLPDVMEGDPHVAAHNDERHAFNQFYGSASTVNPGNIATRIPVSRMTNTILNSDAYTFQATFETVDEFDAVRLVFANNRAESSVVLHCAASTPASAADINNSAGIWVSGKGFFLQTPQQGTDLVTWTVSDWIQVSSVDRSDGGAYPLVTVRAMVISEFPLPVAGGGSDNYTNWASRADGKRRFWWRQMQDYGKAAWQDFTSFTSTTNTSLTPIVGIQYLCRGKVVTVGAVGDSTVEGRGTYLGEGFGYPAIEALNSLEDSVRYEYSNFGWTGQTYDQITNRGVIVSNSPVKPDVFVIPVGTPNPTTEGALTDSDVVSFRSQHAALAASCWEEGVVPVLSTWLPTNTSARDYAGTDTKRVAYNSDILTQASRDVVVADLSGAVSGSVVSGQVQFAAGDSTDGLNPNDQGNLALSQVLELAILEAAKRVNGGRRTLSRRADVPVFYVTQATTGMALNQSGIYVGNHVGSATTWYLPPLIPGGSPDSQIYTIHVRASSAPLTVVTPIGGDFIALNGVTRGSLMIQPGQTVTFFPGQPRTWDVIGLDEQHYQSLKQSGTTTLTLDLTAHVYVYTGASAATWTMPAGATGLFFTVKNRSSSSLILDGAGTQKFYDTAAEDTLTIAPGASVYVVWDGAYWVTL